MYNLAGGSDMHPFFPSYAGIGRPNLTKKKDPHKASPELYPRVSGNNIKGGFCNEAKSKD